MNQSTAKVIADSWSHGSRLTTIEVRFPRPYLAEFNTHRVLSRNSASSRAIPVWKKIQEALKAPYIPEALGKNKAGMQSTQALNEDDTVLAHSNWLMGRNIACLQAFALIGGEEEVLRTSKSDPRVIELCKDMNALKEAFPRGDEYFKTLKDGIHKQHANRVLEPYTYHTVIVTGTHWRNFYALRANKNAQPEAQDFAIAMATAHRASVPVDFHGSDEWHLPYVHEEDRSLVSHEKLRDVATGRCARVSYLTHDGNRDPEEDIRLAVGLRTNGHMSPYEHVARPRKQGEHDSLSGNFDHRWTQYRKLIGNEQDFSQLLSREEIVLGCRGNEALADFILSLSH